MVHEFRDFNDFINKKHAYSNIPRSKLWGPAFTRFAQIPFWAFCLIMTDIFCPKSFLLTDEYASWGFLFKSSYLIAACMYKLFTLVLGFTAMESNFIACGQGYKPAQNSVTSDKKEVSVPEQFNAIRNIDIVPLFSCIDFGELVNAWNI